MCFIILYHVINSFFTSAISLRNMYSGSNLFIGHKYIICVLTKVSLQKLVRVPWKNQIIPSPLAVTNIFNACATRHQFENVILLDWLIFYVRFYISLKIVSDITKILNNS